MHATVCLNNVTPSEVSLVQCSVISVKHDVTGSTDVTIP